MKPRLLTAHATRALLSPLALVWRKGACLSGCLRRGLQASAEPVPAVPVPFLQGRVALVTGGSRGIGLAICRQLAAHGASVAVVSRNQEAAQRAAGELTCVNVARHVGVSFDLGVSSGAADAMDTLVAAVEAPVEQQGLGGPVDILINCAGVSHDGLLVRVPEEKILATLQVNLVAPLLLSRAVLKRSMLRRRTGCIVNIGSIVGSEGNRGQVPYSCSKAGVEGLTKCLAKELQGTAIRVNAVLPGFVHTDMTRHVLSEGSDGSDGSDGRLDHGNVLEPSDVANTVLHLVSPAAQHLRGQLLRLY